MPKLFIPACGDRLRLVAPWSFSLILERRNTKFAETRGLIEKPTKPHWNGIWAGEPYRSGYRRVQVTLPIGTILECDRIYVRLFNKGRVKEENDFDSITWKIIKTTKTGKEKTEGRFWVKLPDCYSIDYELDIDSLYRDRVKVFKEVHDG
jgi:hypothetical protein